MYIFSALFTLSLLLLIIALIILIPKRTRNVGKKASIVFLTTTILLYFIASKENIYPNDEPGTITKAQYQSLKEDMSKNEIQEKLGKPNEKDDDINEWDYKIVDGSTITSKTVSLHFDPSDKLELKLDDDYFNPNKKTEEDNTNTDEQKKTNFDYEISSEVSVEDSVGKTVNWNGDSKDVIRDVQVKGKKDESKYITLKLNAPMNLTKNMIETQVNKNTLKIVKSIVEDPNFDSEIKNITFFWYLPLTDSYGKDKEDVAYKITLKNSTIDKLNLDNLTNIQLNSVADEYQVLFK